MVSSSPLHANRADTDTVGAAFCTGPVSQDVSAMAEMGEEEGRPMACTGIGKCCNFWKKPIWTNYFSSNYWVHLKLTSQLALTQAAITMLLNSRCSRLSSSMAKVFMTSRYCCQNVLTCKLRICATTPSRFSTLCFKIPVGRFVL